ncbi:MAG: nitrate reductase molybdenum cofactor assembly chaperone [Hylemonella sp.]|jgi:nitrate reductase delta subunit
MDGDTSLTLRALARLLDYPHAHLREHLDELAAVLQQAQALRANRRAELLALVRSLQLRDPIDVEADYVQLFDRGRRTALHLFEHVHGDSRERGPAMIDLTRTYEQAGLYLKPGELPDYLPVVLEFASTLPPRQAREFLGETVHILQALFSALLAQHSPYASVLAAVLELTGAQAQAVEVPQEPPLDESWQEPAAFGGCSTVGQAAPGQPQPVHLVRKPATQTAQGA